MKRKHYPVEQIIAVLKQAELGMAAGDIVRQLGISEQTFYRWKKQYSGVQSEQVKELKQLQDENTRLKKAGGRAQSGQSDSASTCTAEKIPSWRWANGSEFSGHLLDLWAYHNKCKIDFGRPGKTTDNSFIESFDGSLRDECLNAHWFTSCKTGHRGLATGLQ